jgi:hypothetical protein
MLMGIAVAAITGEAAAKPPAEWGGFGYATVGGLVGDWSRLESDFNGPDALGPAVDVSPLTLQVGGGGKALLGQWFLLGGKGMGWFVGGERRDDAELSLYGGGGGLDFGVAVYNRHLTLFYPYIGVGGYALSIEVANARESAFRVGSAAVGPGQSQVFTTGFFTADFGLGIQRMMFFGRRDDLSDGGMLAGFEGGLLVPLVKGALSDEAGQRVAGVGDFGISGVYLRLTLGGGAFTFSDDPRYRDLRRDYDDEDLDFHQDYDDF